MKYITISIIFLFLLACNTEAKRSKVPKGFYSLFNGRSLAGWHGVLHSPYDNPYKRRELRKTNPQKFYKLQRKENSFMKKHWKVKNSVLSFDGKGFSIATNKKYKDFELYVSWRIFPNSDSGIYLKATPQIQIWDVNSKHSQRYGSAKGSGGLWNNMQTKKGQFPLTVADNLVGKWNTFFIRMINNVVTIYLNNKLVVHKAPLENYWKKKSPLLEYEQIELQAHGSKVEFKDIFIKEL